VGGVVHPLQQLARGRASLHGREVSLEVQHRALQRLHQPPQASLMLGMPPARVVAGARVVMIEAEIRQRDPLSPSSLFCFRRVDELS